MYIVESGVHGDKGEKSFINPIHALKGLDMAQFMPLRGSCTVGPSSSLLWPYVELVLLYLFKRRYCATGLRALLHVIEEFLHKSAVDNDLTHLEVPLVEASDLVHSETLILSEHLSALADSSDDHGIQQLVVKSKVKDARLVSYDEVTVVFSISEEHLLHVLAEKLESCQELIVGMTQHLLTSGLSFPVVLCLVEGVASESNV